MRIQKNESHLILFILLGFAVGIIYANTVSKEYVINAGIFNEYYFSQYVQMEIVMPEYLWYVIRTRLVPLLTIIILGFLKIRKAAVLAFVSWTGLLAGVLMTAAIMKLGVKGIIFLLIACFPQIIFYFMSYMILLLHFYKYPKDKWNSLKTAVFIGSLAIGIIAECYVNPFFMKMFLKTI